MDLNRRLAAPLALCLAGAALALGACGDDDEDTDVTAVDQDTTVVTETDGNTTTTTNTVTGGGPANAPPSVASCVELWNGQNNLQNQTLLAKETEPGDDSVVNVSPNAATQPPTCVVTLVKGDRAIEWAEAAGQDFPFAAPNELGASELDAERKADNADQGKAGTLTAAG